MNDRARELEQKLRDYPISLRQSARAVFGSAYALAEREAPNRGADDGDDLSAKDAKDRPLFKS